MMHSLRPIFWGQGMFLQPQHFQQQDRYHDARLRQVVHLLQPFAWGVKSLTVDETALQNFIFDIQVAEILTFEGTIIQFRGDPRVANARIGPRSFEHELDPSGRPLAVYIGLRRLQPEEANLETAITADGGSQDQRGGGRHRRHRLVEAHTRDLFSEEDQSAAVQYLGYEPHLLFDVPTSRSQDYELVKVAEVLRSADGKGGVLSKRYVPPSIELHASEVLEGIVKEIRDLLSAKGRELGEYRRRRGGETVELGSRDIGYLLLRQTVNRYIPLLHHFLEIETVHPQQAYALLRQIVGELSTFSEGVSVLGALGDQAPLPPYRHDQIWPLFDLVAARIRQLIEEITTGPVGDVMLRYDGEYFSAPLEESFFAGDNRYYLAIRSDLPPTQLYRQLQETGKISARDEIVKLQRAALFGLKIEVLESPPEELLMRAHYRYFLIDRRSDHWDRIQRQKSIAVFCSSLPSETEIRLVVIFGK